jgi:SHS family lactate transporter-like MFS transporter
MPIAALSGWTSEQKHVVVAAFLGWSLDAFDFFLLVFVLKDIAQEFDTEITHVANATFLTWRCDRSALTCSGVQPTAGVVGLS